MRYRFFLIFFILPIIISACSEPSDSDGIYGNNADADSSDEMFSDAENGFPDTLHDETTDNITADKDGAVLTDTDWLTADNDGSDGSEFPDTDEHVPTDSDTSHDEDSPQDEDSIIPDKDTVPPTDDDVQTDIDTCIPEAEICDDIDNNCDGTVDEGCDDDKDGWCDTNMITDGVPDTCPNGLLDCDDTDSDIYPGSTVFREGVDYDCDNKKEYMAVLTISVDDTLIDLCVNGEQLPEGDFGPNYGAWTHSDTYTGDFFILETGRNVIGIHGRDAGKVISAFMATIEVNGQLLITDGVMPPADDQEYEPTDPEWDDTQWRYYPTPENGEQAGWCGSYFDDSTWGPAIRAGFDGQTDPLHWGELGASPWTNTDCGATACPSIFLPYYQDAISGNEPYWIWDYNPASLQDAWFRRIIILP